MSNKLKTLSASQLESFISEAVSNYLDEEVECSVGNLSTPRFDEEDEEAIKSRRDLHFSAELVYNENSEA